MQRGGAVEFDPPLRPGILIRRYKRFLADVQTMRGPLTMHCANTGAMTGCAEQGSGVWYSTASNPRRRYRHTLELVRTSDAELIAVNTAHANRLVADAFKRGLVPGFRAGLPVRREVPIPASAHASGVAGRFDLAVGETLVEVKTVTLKVAGQGAFPDAVSTRATRHVDALAALARAGRATALVFCVLHTGIHSVRPADEVDPAYGAALRNAVAAGVQVLALRCAVSVGGIAPTGLLPVATRLASAAPIPPCRR